MSQTPQATHGIVYCKVRIRQKSQEGIRMKIKLVRKSLFSFQTITDNVTTYLKNLITLFTTLQ